MVQGLEAENDKIILKCFRSRESWLSCISQAIGQQGFYVVLSAGVHCSAYRLQVFGGGQADSECLIQS